jgi:hypothetical protein
VQHALYPFAGRLALLTAQAHALLSRSSATHVPEKQVENLGLADSQVAGATAFLARTDHTHTERHTRTILEDEGRLASDVGGDDEDSPLPDTLAGVVVPECTQACPMTSAPVGLLRCQHTGEQAGALCTSALHQPFCQVDVKM